MREILFRGKEIIGGSWITGFLVDDKHIGNWELSVHVKPETVGQFTGLTDKNGKRIFEGDICKIHNLEYKVEFKYSQWQFTILSKTVYCFPAFNSHCGEYCEVIGNIHDNPELLQVQKDGEGL